MIGCNLMNLGWALFLMGCSTASPGGSNAVAATTTSSVASVGSATVSPSLEASARWPQPERLIVRKVIVPISSESPGLVEYRSAESGGVCMFMPHENESAGFAVAYRALGSMSGRIIRVEQGQQRNVAFDSLQVDPNRIFSASGVRASALALNNVKAFTSEKSKAIETFAQNIMKTVDACMAHSDTKTLIAIHNNTDGGFSVQSYLTTEKASAERVKDHPNLDPDDFFLTTDKKIFDKLSPKWNIVLQSATAPDDGSLSIAWKGRSYVNVEAEHGHTEEQERMIRAVFEAMAD